MFLDALPLTVWIYKLATLSFEAILHHNHPVSRIEFQNDKLVISFSKGSIVGIWSEDGANFRDASSTASRITPN